MLRLRRLASFDGFCLQLMYRGSALFLRLAVTESSTREPFTALVGDVAALPRSSRVPPARVVRRACIGDAAGTRLRRRRRGGGTGTALLSVDVPVAAASTSGGGSRRGDVLGPGTVADTGL